MATQETGKYCKTCQGNTLARRKGTNHILHLLLTLLTGGLWVIVWILTSVKIGGWRCTQCGSKI